ncbi:MAG TPA: hypothetical protein VK487_00975 [Candidatus Bathyarchaeia archaeon]|nr:hypothetical protein [Candidatus Bathyarchaeia archaeon]
MPDTKKKQKPNESSEEWQPDKGQIDDIQANIDRKKKGFTGESKK